MDEMKTLTADEIDLLISGADMLEANARRAVEHNRATINELDILKHEDCPACPDRETHDRRANEARTKAAANEAKFKALREQLIMLRAKLLGMRQMLDSAAADRFINDAIQTTPTP